MDVNPICFKREGAQCVQSAVIPKKTKNEKIFYKKYKFCHRQTQTPYRNVSFNSTFLKPCFNRSNVSTVTGQRRLGWQATQTPTEAVH